MIVHESGERSDVSVAVCIPTFRRPDDLARLLSTLPSTISEAQRQGRCGRVDVIVIDNDDRTSAASVVRAAAIEARYVVEHTRGVAAVRNRALEEASSSDLLVFIDDDETPAADDWLERMLATRTEHRAHAVAGPVRTVADGPLDPWIAAGGFFARAHRAALVTGSPISRAATNNLLLDRRFVAQAGVRFDPRFGLSGGEDSLFTSELHRQGATMVWCAEAVVLDHLPPERRTRSHALQRTRGMASAGVRVAVVLAGHGRAARLRVRLRAIAAAVVRLAAGSGLVLAGLVSRSQRLDAIGRREWARGAGSLEGVFGDAKRLYGGDGASGSGTDPAPAGEAGDHDR